VGAPGYDGSKTDTGGAFLYHGSASGLATTAAWSVSGEQSGDQFGIALAAAGDVNNDGYDDVLVGAPGFDGTAGSGSGKVYLFLGGAGGLATTAGWTVTGPSAGAELGAAVAGAGNVNGDSYADLLVGAPGYSSSTGRIVVYHGQSTVGGISANLTQD